MNPTSTQLQRSLKKISRRGFLASASTFLVFLRSRLRYRAGSFHAESSQAPGLSQGVLDLYAIFKDEIRTNYNDNVYVSLGNKLHLDG